MLDSQTSVKWFLWLAESPQVPSREFFGRWAHVQIDDTLEAIDQGIVALVGLSELVAANSRPDIREEALDDLECAAFATARELPKALALDPNRLAPPPFDAGQILVTAVSQYLAYVPNDAEKVIVAGTQLAGKCAIGLLSPFELSDIEHSYQMWAIPLLIRHLVYDGYNHED